MARDAILMCAEVCMAYSCMLLCLMKCSVLTEAGILPHLASHVLYDAKKLDILTEVCWVLTYLTAWYVFYYLHCSLAAKSCLTTACLFVCLYKS